MNNGADRMPPHNIDAERGVLGSILLDPAALDEVRPLLTPDDFFRDIHQILYRRIVELGDRRVPIDTMTLADELERRGELTRIGGDDALVEILESVPHAANARYCAGIVRDKATLRRLIEAAHEQLRECYAAQETADDLVARSEARAYALAERTAGDPELVNPAAQEAMARLAKRRAGEYAGIATGLVDLDAITDGLAPGQLTILAARPSMGKTALALNIAAHAALEASVPTLIVSIEMARIEVAERLIIAGARLDGHRIKKGEFLDDGDEQQLHRAYDALALTDRLWLDDSASWTPATLLACARRMQRKVGLGLMVVDYLQLLDSDGNAGRKESQYERITTISRRLKAIARELAIPLLVLCQLNRAAENRDGHRPRMADLRDSGSIEQDADMVWLLHRPDYYNPNDQPGAAELAVAKNRNGRTGTVSLTFIRESATFESFAPDPVARIGDY
jgi:replicative DNA helicase